MTICKPAMTGKLYLHTRSLLLALLTVSPIAVAQETKIPGSEDFMALEVIRSAEISPAGDRVAFTVFNNDFENDTDMTQLWLVSATVR